MTSFRRTNRQMCKWRIALGTLAFALELFTQAGFSQNPLFAAWVPMLDCSGLPCIELETSSGNHLKMLIDTGNVKFGVERSEG